MQRIETYLNFTRFIFAGSGDSPASWLGGGTSSADGIVFLSLGDEQPQKAVAPTIAARSNATLDAAVATSVHRTNLSYGIRICN